MTDFEFGQLLAAQKYFEKELRELPNDCGRYDLLSSIGEFELTIDFRHKYFEFKQKYHLQDNYRALVRLELNSRPHMNPDGSRTGRHHIHIYKDSPHNLPTTNPLPWAYDLSSFDKIQIKNYTDVVGVFFSFCAYCNIKQPDNMQTRIC